MALAFTRDNLIELTRYALRRESNALDDHSRQHRALRHLLGRLESQEGTSINIASIPNGDVRKAGYSLIRDLHKFSKAELKVSSANAKAAFSRIVSSQVSTMQKLKDLLGAYEIAPILQDYFVSQFPEQVKKVTNDFDDHGDPSRLLWAIYDQQARLSKRTQDNEVYFIYRILDICSDPKTGIDHEPMSEAVRDLIKSLMSRPLLGTSKETALDAFAQQDLLDARVQALDNRRRGYDNPFIRIPENINKLNNQYIIELNQELQNKGRVYVWQARGENSDINATGVARIKNIDEGKGVLVEVWDEKRNQTIEFKNKDPKATIHINGLDATRA